MAFAAFATLLFMRPIWDIDIFWHLSAGQWMVEHQSIVTTDIMGVDPLRPWISFQWGYQVLSYLLFEAGGYRLLRIVHAALMLLTFALLYRCYHKALKSRWIAFILLGFTLLLFQDRINVRPHIINFLGLAIILPALLGEWREASKLQLGGLLLWFGFWANMHAGGCFLMLIVLAAIPLGASAQQLIYKQPSQSKKAWLFYCSCVLICVLSPNFVRGIVHAMSLVQATGDTIGEWNAPIAYLTVLENPTPSRIVAGLTPYICALWIVVLAIKGRRPIPDLGRVAAAIALSGLSLLYVRFVHLCAPIILILWTWTLREDTLKARWRPILTAAVAVLLFGMLWHTNIHRLFGGLQSTIEATSRDLDERRFPLEAADFLESAEFKGSVFSHARYGGFLRWRLGAGVRTLMDGRSNVDASTAKEILWVHQNKGGMAENHAVAKQISNIYDKHNLDALVLEPPVFSIHSLNCARWTLAFRTPKLEIYYRNDAKNAANLRAIGRIPGDPTGCGRTP